ncbi:hypothetical protein PTH_2772 [Pelotomaculum thermopropionicum SI]|uniref:Glycosyltransferase n=1 Tax=Pelotomaculum thermopropionicum (strain DSM 13744 / JCM 10971 / SI) TaxID=370438 RepID=A5CYH0_PELTS|nr:hypothetical protein PTH_2772 [Pelotomaculum thermopropionicum SI]
MLRGETILCLAAARWEGMWARAQQLMSIFARRGNRVIYVNPPITYLSPLKDPSLRGQAGGCCRREGENIYVYTPPVILPFGNIFRPVNRVNQKVLHGSLKILCRELGLEPTICWTYLPNTVDMPLPEGVTLVYDCADEHTAFPGLIKKETVAGMERELFARAGVSLASAGELYRRKKEFAPGLALVPNGADVPHFNGALKPELAVPEDVASLPRPVVGYIGAVSAWLDLEMMAAAACTHPEWSIALIGPVDADVSSLAALPNVHLLGHRGYGLLPAYLKGFDVAVIPFKINELTRGVNPVKLYEYLAAGRPVVSSALPEVLPFAEVVAVARDPHEFVKKIEAELAGNTPEKVAARLRLAAQNSWEARAAAAEEVIERYRRAAKRQA